MTVIFNVFFTLVFIICGIALESVVSNPAYFALYGFIMCAVWWIIADEIYPK